MAETEDDKRFAATRTQSATDSLFSPIRTKRAFDEISQEIKRLIFKGALRPGDKLPSEMELADQFDVGRQTIREALRLLELSGFISMKKGGTGGPVVVDTILSTIASSFLDAFQMGTIRPDEHTKARVEIEKMVLGCVFENIDQTDIEALQDNIDRARRKLANREQAFEENIHFHRLLARASKNQIFFVVMQSITALVANIRSLLGMDHQLTISATEEHQEILNAIIARNKTEALALLERHLLRIGSRYEGWVKEIALEKT